MFGAFFGLKSPSGWGGTFIKDKKVRIPGITLIRGAKKANLVTKKRRRWVKILFAAWVVFFFSAFSAYFNYNYCADADFPSPKPRIESLDQDYLIADEINKFEISRPNLLPTIVENILPRELLSFSQKSPHALEPVILRC